MNTEYGARPFARDPSIALLDECLAHVRRNSCLRVVALLAPLDPEGASALRAHVRATTGLELIYCDGSGSQRLKLALEPAGAAHHGERYVFDRSREIVQEEARRLYERGADAVIAISPAISAALSGGAFEFPVLDPWAVRERQMLAS